MKIGTSQRIDLLKKENDSKPSPFDYNPTDMFVKTHSAAWGFGTSSRPSLNNKKNDIPGPNSYSIPSKIVEGPKYVIGGRTSVDKIDDKPGPGQYETAALATIKLKSDPAFSVGTGKRSDLANLKEREHIPGPGNYQTLDDSFTKKAAPMYGFGTSKREDSLEKSRKTLPYVGPGSYDNKGLIGSEGRKNSISHKLNDNLGIKESRNLPGPGTYDVLYSTQIVTRSMPQYKIGTSKRTENVSKERLLIPDPGAY